MQKKAIRVLLAAVIDRAIDDLKGIGPKCHSAEPDRAMAFILSDTCEAWCLELCIDYDMIKEKSASLYRQLLEKGQPKRHRKAFRYANIRQSPGKRLIGTGK